MVMNLRVSIFKITMVIISLLYVLFIYLFLFLLFFFFFLVLVEYHIHRGTLHAGSLSTKPGSLETLYPRHYIGLTNDPGMCNYSSR